MRMELEDEVEVRKFQNAGECIPFAIPPAVSDEPSQSSIPQSFTPLLSH